MTKDEMTKFAESKGFDQLMAHSGDKRWFRYANLEKQMSLIIYPVDGQVELEAIIGLFFLRSGKFMLDHPNHDTLFQYKFEDILEALEQFRN